MTIQPELCISNPTSSLSLAPPSSYLPPIKSLAQQSPDYLRGYLRYLQLIYKPDIRGSRRQRCKLHTQSTPSFASIVSSASSSSLSSAFSTTAESELTTLRQDPFERTYALRWLTALIRISEFNPYLEHESESIIKDAAALLAVCSGTSGAGTVVREYEIELGDLDLGVCCSGFGGLDGVGRGCIGCVGCAAAAARSEVNSMDGNGHGQMALAPETIKITLTDVPLENAHFGSVGAQTWGGACVLAEEIASEPFRFFPTPKQLLFEFRVLELGAGTGLVSLAVGKVAEVLMGRCMEVMKMKVKVDIVATDYYPSVLKNLEDNLRVNFPFPSSSPPSLSLSTSTPHSSLSETPAPPISISSHFLDWSSFSVSPHPPSSGPLIKPFDLILGADIVYEAEHAEWIKGCVEKLLRRPSTGGSGERGGKTLPYAKFHLVIPMRRLFEAESGSVERVFRFCREGEGEGEGDELELVIQSKEFIVCDADSEKEGEVVQYAYYVIGWGRGTRRG